MLVSILLVTLVCFLVYLWMIWNHDYWKKRGVPFDKPMLLFGNFKDGITGVKHFGELYEEFYKKYPNAPYVGFFKMGTPIILLRDVDLVKDVLIKEFNSFADNDVDIDPALDPQFAVNPFALKGSSWKTRRAQWSSSLTGARLRRVFTGLPNRCQLMVNYIQEQEGTDICSRDISLKYLVDVIVNNILGLQNDSFADADNMFKRIASELFSLSYFKSILIMALILVPSLTKYLKLRIISLKTQNDLIMIARNMIANRKQYGYMPNDFFENLIDKTEFESEKAMLEEISGRVFGFLVDGVETSSGLFDFMLYELADHPEAQQKLRDELEKAAKDNGGEISFEEIQNLPYMNMVASEVLRLYPPAAAMHRICTRSTKLGELPVDPGLTIVIPVLALQRDPQLFPNPFEFIPERFAPDAPPVNKGSYMPFGEGPRICIGGKLAMLQVKTGIACLIRNFEISLSSKTPSRPLPLDPLQFLTRVKGGIWLNFKKLKN